MPNASTLSAKMELNRQSYLRFAKRPFVVGPWSEAYAGWRLVYEAKSAIRDQNPVFAASILPKNGALTTGYPGIVLRPAGVVVEVDKVRPGSVSVTVDVAGALTATVFNPDFAPLTAAVTTTTTRNTLVFDAFADGLYEITVLLDGALVTTLIIPIQRDAFSRLREDNRANDGGFAFKANRRPKASETFNTRLALVIAKEAAAATGQRELYAQLDEAEQALPRARTPVALFPAHRQA